jgi:hypothetical protein
MVQDPEDGEDLTAMGVITEDIDEVDDSPRQSLGS